MASQSELVTIVGSGPAGLTAAIYTARMGLSPLVIDGPLPGGQLMTTFLVENWPGEQKISGPKLITNIRDHAQLFGTRFLSGSVESIELTSPFKITLNTEETITSQTIIIASGSKPRRLGCPGEEKYWGRGVSSCAICDGALFQDKQVLVVGGGNSALEYVLFLSQFTKKITLIHRGTSINATEQRLKEQVLKLSFVKTYFSTIIISIEGDNEQITAANIQDLNTGSKRTLDVAGIFLAIGSQANSSFLPKEIALSENKQIIVNNGTHTTIPGIFSAGDVANKAYRQAITASGTGCQAALDAQKYLKKTGILLN